MRPDLGRGPAKPTTGRIPMSEFTVTRSLKDPRERVWQVLTQPSHFEGWLPAKSGTAVLDVRTGGALPAPAIFPPAGGGPPARRQPAGPAPAPPRRTIPRPFGAARQLASP